MNLADSERMAGTLESVGYVCAEDASEADVIVYNTCSIRDKAEQKVYSALGKQVGTAIIPSCYVADVFLAGQQQRDQATMHPTCGVTPEELGCVCFRPNGRGQTWAD
jgi:hypothetical protein